MPLLAPSQPDSFLEPFSENSEIKGKLLIELEARIREKCSDPEKQTTILFQPKYVLSFLYILEFCKEKGCFGVAFMPEDITKYGNNKTKPSKEEMWQHIALFATYNILSFSKTDHYRTTDAFIEMLEQTFAACGV